MKAHSLIRGGTNVIYANPVKSGLVHSGQRALHLQEQTSSDTKQVTVRHLCSDSAAIQPLWQLVLKHCSFQLWPQQEAWLLWDWDEQNCWGPVQAHHWAVRFKMCLLWDNLSPEPVTWLLESGWVMGGRSCALLKSDIRFDCLRAKMRCCFFI